MKIKVSSSFAALASALPMLLLGLFLPLTKAQFSVCNWGNPNTVRAIVYCLYCGEAYHLFWAMD